LRFRHFGLFPGDPIRTARCRAAFRASATTVRLDGTGGRQVVRPDRGTREQPAERKPMAKSPSANPEEARRRAEDRFRKAKQREGEAQSAYEELAKLQKAEAIKTDRLRALRLAKEAADAENARREAEAKALAAGESRQRKAAREAKTKPA
jgi:hypothetical protein